MHRKIPRGSEDLPDGEGVFAFGSTRFVVTPHRLSKRDVPYRIKPKMESLLVRLRKKRNVLSQVKGNLGNFV